MKTLKMNYTTYTEEDGVFLPVKNEVVIAMEYLQVYPKGVDALGFISGCTKSLLDYMFTRCNKDGILTFNGPDMELFLVSNEYKYTRSSVKRSVMA